MKAVSYTHLDVYKRQEYFLSKTLFEVGIPLMHVVGGRVGIEETIYYEFDGDKEEVFRGC